MGLYVNPRDMSKEAWLKANATSGHRTTMTMPSNTREHEGQREMVVCLVDNGAFTAAGVATSLGELKAFDNRSDGREKLWYWVPIAKLEEVLGVKLEDYA